MAGAAGARRGGSVLRAVPPAELARLPVLGPELRLLADAVGELANGVVTALAVQHGASELDVVRWETVSPVRSPGPGERACPASDFETDSRSLQANAPWRLPSDLVALLTGADGFTMRWATPLPLQLREVGIVSVNGLQKLVPVAGAPSGMAGAFALTSLPGYGTTALCYLEAGTLPEVWFRNMAGEWHVLARSVGDWLRLVLTHGGIRGWEYALSAAGLDPETEQLLRMIAPRRLAIDRDRAELAEWVSEQPPQRLLAASLAFLDEEVAREPVSSAAGKKKERPHSAKPRASQQGRASTR
jgi:hypothetical protein